MIAPYTRNGLSSSSGWSGYRSEQAEATLPDGLNRQKVGRRIEPQLECYDVFIYVALTGTLTMFARLDRNEEARLGSCCDPIMTSIRQR